MSLPFFYAESIAENTNVLELDENNSRHLAGVLRMQAGESLHLTDGRGGLVTAEVAIPDKKKCRITVTGRAPLLPAPLKTGIGISLLKNPSRFEWFLEKATEIGINEIFPLLCSRTERQHFRQDRMKNVLVSALIQSRQRWLPVLHPPTAFETVLTVSDYDQKFIAHCMEEEKAALAGMVQKPARRLVLIGPEGDFSPAEITAAMQHGLCAVTLGTTRLRTETAGLAAAVLLQSFNV